jgi:hypothetical protein
MAILPLRLMFDEVGELVAAHGAARGREHHVERLPARLVLGQRHDRW